MRIDGTRNQRQSVENQRERVGGREKKHVAAPVTGIKQAAGNYHLCFHVQKDLPRSYRRIQARQSHYEKGNVMLRKNFRSRTEVNVYGVALAF